MKYLLIIASLAITGFCNAQSTPKVYDPCQKTDTNTIKKLIIGTWVDIKDSTHVMVITTDSVEETIVINMGGNVKTNVSFWNYKFTDNVFSSDAVTCYSLVEYKDGYSNTIEMAINSIDDHYLLTGASGKAVYKRKG